MENCAVPDFRLEDIVNPGTVCLHSILCTKHDI